MLTAFPDVANEFLFSDKTGIHIEQSGDALILHSCKEITVYKIKWSQKINQTCYHLIPLTSSQFNGTKFLELTTRKILPTSHKIKCKDRPTNIFVKDIHNIFWKFIRPDGFLQIKPKELHHYHLSINLPILGSYNKKLTYYKKASPHRITLLNLLAKQTENIESLSDFNEEDDGNIILGITRGIAKTVNYIESKGESLFKLVTNTVFTGVKVITNSTEGIIDSSANGIKKIFKSIGLSNFILYIVNFLIIIYLILMRFAGNRLKFLFDKPDLRNPHKEPHYKSPETERSKRHQQYLPPPIEQENN